MHARRRPHDVKHVKILSNGEFFALVGGESYATLDELVEFYMANPRMVWCCTQYGKILPFRA